MATVAVETDLPFLPVPFGTRNHFARDAGFDVDDPLAALAADEERRVDVGAVSERAFPEQRLARHLRLCSSTIPGGGRRTA